MKQTIYIQGMTCGSCVEKITELFKKHYSITDINIDKDSGKVEYEHEVFLTNSDITKMLSWTNYSIWDIPSTTSETELPITLSTYIPLFTLFGYIVLFSLLAEYISWSFDIMRFMQHFMWGFFISFSYFKLINLKEFAMSYSMYDVVAKKWNNWWYVYAFIELGLGISYFIWFAPLLTNMVTLVVMSLSIIWVLQSVAKKQKIKCACLWAVFNLPMSWITIIEDALMIVMSWAMILIIL
jgi:copper chaperone CopZ